MSVAKPPRTDEEVRAIQDKLREQVRQSERNWQEKARNDKRNIELCRENAQILVDMCRLIDAPMPSCTYHDLLAGTNGVWNGQKLTEEEFDRLSAKRDWFLSIVRGQRDWMMYKDPELERILDPWLDEKKKQK